MKKVLQNINKLRFQNELLNWYEANKRDLPWRQTTDPYKIWVSEIMLQQTQVDTVIPYYEKFLKQYPTVFALEEADEQDVLKLWEGLGYYTRARNLYTAAKDVVTRFNGVIPSDPKELGSLRGIGPYTQGAILSIAFNQPEPAVDGNVMRVLSRVLYIEDDITKVKTRKMFEKIIYELISKENPSSFNQGLMEIGALICTPKQPACMLCPFMEQCTAFSEGVTEFLPVKKKQKRQKELDFYVLIIENESGEIAIEQRPSEGLLANMWQFPMVSKQNLKLNNYLENDYGLVVQLDEQIGDVRHVFSHVIWNLTVYRVIVHRGRHEEWPFRMISKEKLRSYPFSVSHLKVMEFFN